MVSPLGQAMTFNRPTPQAPKGPNENSPARKGWEGVC